LTGTTDDDVSRSTGTEEGFVVFPLPGSEEVKHLYVPFNLKKLDVLLTDHRPLFT
jgi:hypothetical protein